MYVYFDTLNYRVYLAHRIAPEKPRRSDFDAPEPRIGRKDIWSPRWLTIRRLWAMLLPSSIDAFSAAISRRRKRKVFYKARYSSDLHTNKLCLTFDEREMDLYAKAYVGIKILRL